MLRAGPARHLPEKADKRFEMLCSLKSAIGCALGIALFNTIFYGDQSVGAMRQLRRDLEMMYRLERLTEEDVREILKDDERLGTCLEALWGASEFCHPGLSLEFRDDDPVAQGIEYAGHENALYFNADRVDWVKGLALSEARNSGLIGLIPTSAAATIAATA
jgi:hypothetical protein